MGYTKASSSTLEILNPYFANTEKDYVYKARIKAFKNEFGGILALKKIDPKSHRIVFTTEMGNTIFDFSFLGSEFKVNKILKELDRKILIAILKRDILALIQERTEANAAFVNNGNILIATKIKGKSHYYKYQDKLLKKIARVSNQKEKVIFTFSEISDNIVQNIEIQHKNIDLTISLKAF